MMATATQPAVCIFGCLDHGNHSHECRCEPCNVVRRERVAAATQEHTHVGVCVEGECS